MHGGIKYKGSDYHTHVNVSPLYYSRYNNCLLQYALVSRNTVCQQNEWFPHITTWRCAVIYGHTIDIRLLMRLTDNMKHENMGFRMKLV